MKLISEYWDDNSQVMGDDTLVEVARSFEIDTEREVDRYVSVEIRCGIEARDKDNEIVTDLEEIAKLEEEWLEWSDERDKAHRHALVSWSVSSFMRWEDKNPEPISYSWVACEEYATKDDLEAEYDNHEYEYGESYSYTSFNSEAEALEDAKRMLRSVNWERDFSF